MMIDLFTPADISSHKNLMSQIASAWLKAEPFDRGEVHAQKLDKPEMVTKELLGVNLEFDIPLEQMQLAALLNANLPWAEDHFQERVSGEPLNPPPSNEWWPYAQSGNAEHKGEDQKFSHTYPERFWPRFAEGMFDRSHQGAEFFSRRGIRFDYGDLNDLVRVLKKNPRSRQAYLPVWFPEDLTASVLGERVPCTLGYHFLLHPDGKLHATYFMRSCDIVRFFRDDVYMAGRLLQWVADRIKVQPGTLRMHISSLHAFVGDTPWMQAQVIAQPTGRDRYATYNFGALG